MRPGGDPEGWRVAYFEASAARPERGPVDSFGRFLLAFLPALALGQWAVGTILERML
jgi:hypothetical protein